MRIPLTAVALATLVVSPALAQQPQPRADARAQAARTQAVRPAPPAPAAAVHAQETEAYAAYTGYGDVIVDGQSVGSDPDANIRFQLRRDPAINID